MGSMKLETPIDKSENGRFETDFEPPHLLFIGLLVEAVHANAITISRP